MPRDILHIEKFDKGIVITPDIEDVPVQAAVAKQNVDGDTEQGTLKGIADVTIKTAASNADILNGKNFALIKNPHVLPLEQYTLLKHDSNNNKIAFISDFFGTPSVESDTDATTDISDDLCFTEDGTKVHVGTGSGSVNVPKWIGYITHKRFNANPSTSLLTVNAIIDNPASGTYVNIESMTYDTVAGFFTVGIIYEWGITLVYDGYQESLLRMGSQWESTPNSNASQVTLELKIYHSADLNKRITSLNIYRREKSAGLQTQWRFVKNVDITGTGWTGDVSNHTQSVIDTGVKGDTYEQLVGISDTLPSVPSVNYSLSAIWNDHHIVGRCYHSAYVDSASMLFRSKKGCYDLFDWSQDYLVLPFIPVALTSYGGRIFAFSQNEMVIINPEVFAIETVTKGIGCMGKSSIGVYEPGMFWCDFNNIYHYDGSSIIPIGDPIRSSTETSATLSSSLTGNTNWQASANVYNTLSDKFSPIVSYSSIKRYVMFIYIYSSGDKYPEIWAYHISNKRWDRWIFTSYYCNFHSGAFLGKDGYVYMQTTTKLLKLLSDTNNMNFVWVSSELLKEKYALKKRFSKMKLVYNGTAPAVKYGLAAALTSRIIASNTTLTLSNGVGNIGSSFGTYGISMKFQITSSASNTKVYNANLIYRILIGTR